MSRPNYITVLVGAPHTGKTTETLNLIKSIPKRGLIFDANNETKYKEFPLMPIEKLSRWKSSSTSTYRIISDSELELLEAVVKSFRNGFLVLEDATAYIDSGTKEERVLKKLLVKRRHWNVDLIITFHTLGSIPKKVCGLMNFLVIKKTAEDISEIKNLTKVPNKQEVLKAFAEVNAHKDPYFKKVIRIQ